MDTMNVTVSRNRPGQPGGRRVVVNGKLLSYKQTAQFEKFMEESETFRTRFAELSAL